MKLRIGVSFALTLAACTAWAHHSMSAVFDLNQRFTVTGTMSRVDWRNPHTYLTVEAMSDQGRMETWLFEGPPPTAFRVLKVGKVDFENAIGKQIKVEASRARDGSLRGLMRIISLPDGKVVLLCPQNC